MTFDQYIMWGWALIALLALIFNQPFSYFLFAIVLAAIYNTRYDLKKEIKRIRLKEDEIADDLTVETNRLKGHEQVSNTTKEIVEDIHDR